MSATNETTRAILKYLFYKGIYAWRNNVTGIPLPGGGFRPAAKTGISDILAVLPHSGRFCAIEIKTGRDRLRPEQEGFLKNVEAMGGLSMVVSSFDNFLEQWNELEVV